MHEYTAAERRRFAADLDEALAHVARPNFFGRRRRAEVVEEPIDRSAFYHMLMDRGVPTPLARDATARARGVSAHDRATFYRALSDAGFDLTSAEDLAIEAAERRVRPNHHLTSMDDRRAFVARVRRVIEDVNRDFLQAAEDARGTRPHTAVAILYDAAEKAALRFRPILMEMGDCSLPARPPAKAGTKARLNYVERVVAAGAGLAQRASSPQL